MRNSLLALAAALVLSLGAVACTDNAQDHKEEAADARTEAAQEAASGDTEDAREESAEAAQHDSAAARDLGQGDTTEMRN